MTSGMTVGFLPPSLPHTSLHSTLLQLLSDVAARESVNKMGYSNLAVVFAPTLFYIKGNKGPPFFLYFISSLHAAFSHAGEKMLKEVEMQISTASTLKLMIEYHTQLLEVCTGPCCHVLLVYLCLCLLAASPRLTVTLHAIFGLHCRFPAISLVSCGS
jgi:hypothetical protein